MRSLEESLSSGDVSLESGDIEDDIMTEAEAIHHEERQKICERVCYRLGSTYKQVGTYSPVSEYGSTFSTRQEVHMRATGSYVCGTIINRKWVHTHK